MKGKPPSVVDTDPTRPREGLLEAAAETLRSGGIVALPTETIYGLAVDGRDEAGLARVNELKGKPRDAPVLLLLADVGQAETVSDALPALFLPLYYLCDATLTLGRRALRGETVWHAHREHLYQRAVQAGHGHAQVALMVLGCNSVLIALALLASTGHPWPALLGAGAFMAVGLLILERRLTHDT